MLETESNEIAATKGLDHASPVIDTFTNRFRGTLYVHTITAKEFTSMCPKTGHPDFAIVEIKYIADERCYELKSLKEYLHSFRGRGIFYENLVNVITSDLIDAAKPLFIRVVVRMTGRGGLSSVLSRTVMNCTGGTWELVREAVEHDAEVI